MKVIKYIEPKDILNLCQISYVFNEYRVRFIKIPTKVGHIPAKNETCFII
jgi:hypothetical protein